MNPLASPSLPWSFKKKFLVTACVLFGIGGVGMASAAIWYQYNFHAGKFHAVTLNPTEKQVLDGKVAVISGGQTAARTGDPSKILVLSEREINGYLEEQGWGDHVKVSIGGGRLSASALIPMDQEVPLIGGKTVRVKIVLSPQIDAGHLFALYFSDLTIGGISPPNAWLGGIKGMNLLQEMKSDPLMKGLSEGIKDLQLQDGEVRLTLND